jgi:hypothetical protein
MKTPIASILCFLAESFFRAAGQFLYKSGADYATRSILSYILNVRILGGVACYIAVIVLFVAACKRGGLLTVLYPIYSTTFMWAAPVRPRSPNPPKRPCGSLTCNRRER